MIKKIIDFFEKIFKISNKDIKINNINNSTSNFQQFTKTRIIKMVLMKALKNFFAVGQKRSMEK